ncbi:DUF4327 domain-containing protein [Tumidithrix helvetica PCC 7403]|uniref:DUF4327 family protein n=1 Tax=Tumidithrix helvetica TaxID=3457545 RepID=UPI003CA81EA0
MIVQTLQYSIGAIRDEARHLVESGSLNRHQPIHALCRFYPDREWCQIEQELEMNQFLLRDRICDLVSQEDWSCD